MQLTNRVIFTVISLGCIGLLGFGYYLQFFEHLEPCPMCIFQRICYFLIVIIAGVAALHNPQVFGSRIYA
ncbi:MAG: disulfide bond formation protein B, partial [Gammaproteobacteria bacterium]